MRNSMKSKKLLLDLLVSVTNLPLARVWLDCHGENPGDVENLGPISYFPSRGFPASFYPYLNQVYTWLGMPSYERL